MGTALAQVIANNGYSVKLWNHAGDLAPLQQIKKYQINKKYLAKIKLSKLIAPEADIEQAVKSADIIFLTVPSFFIKDVVMAVKNYLPKKAVCVDVSKGIDQKSLGIIPDVIKKNLPAIMRSSVATISGPAIAIDMAKGGYTAMNVGSASSRSILLIKQVMENDHLRLIATSDIMGIELVGSFKNVYAIAMGICDGLKMPMNSKSALLTLALQEIGHLVKKMGGKSQTVYGLAGLGDLVGTGLCANSRNRRFGEYLASGLNTQKALAKVGQVVEGISAAQVLHALSKKYQVKLGLAEMVYQIVCHKSNPAQTMKKFLKSTWV